jgi:hypothetical protein
MGVVRRYRNDEHWPEYGTLVLRDAPTEGQRAGSTEPERDGPPWDYPPEVQPSGTVARAGAGFLEGAARDAYQVVRLELHDAPPPDDRTDWDDVLETPYLSRTGAVGLTYVTGGGGSPDLDLGQPGRYAVRVAVRAGGSDGDEWCLRFWPDPDASTVDIPRYLVRRRPATGAGRDGWEDVVGWPVQPIRLAVAAATGTGVTVEQIDAWGVAHHRSPGWLDAPLWPQPPVLPPTGHADLDAHAEQRRQEGLARNAQEAAVLAGIAAQLGVAAPGVGRDLIPLLAAAGLLVVDDSGGQPRYRPGQPRRVQDVLDLPPDRVRQLEQRNATERYRSFATDLVSVAVWAPDRPAVSTVDALATRLLATPAEVRATLRYAAEVGQLVVQSDGDGDAEPVRLSVGPGRPRQPAQPSRVAVARPAVHADTVATATVPEELMARLMAEARRHASAGQAARTAGTGERHGDNTEAAADGTDESAEGTGEGESPTTGIVILRRSAERRSAGGGLSLGGTPVPYPGPASPPLGAPPRAGYLTTGGDVVVWRDGQPVTIAAGTGRLPYRALQTAYGVALFTSSGLRHVRTDGGAEQLAVEFAVHGAVSEDGRWLAFAEGRHGRHGWYRVHLVDLADSSRHTMPWDGTDEHLAVVGLHTGVVYVRARTGLLRWAPGAGPAADPGASAAPEPLPYELHDLDPLSGTRLTTEGRPELVLTRPDGTATRLTLDLSAALAPGGTRLYTFRSSPPAVTLFDVERGVADPAVHWLPPECETSRSVPRRPYWEDEHHLLFIRRSWRRDDAPAVRLDVRSGALEPVPLTAEAGHQPALVQPLLPGPGSA